jgi:hypothetical protein
MRFLPHVLIKFLLPNPLPKRTGENLPRRGNTRGLPKETTTKNAARMPQINERNRLPWSALRCHRDRLSTAILAPFLAVEKKPARFVGSRCTHSYLPRYEAKLRRCLMMYLSTALSTNPTNA